MLPRVHLSSEVLHLLQGNERPESVVFGVCCSLKNKQYFDCTNSFFSLVVNVIVFMANCGNSTLFNTKFAFRISNQLFASGMEFTDNILPTICPYIESLDIVNETFSPGDQMDTNAEYEENMKDQYYSVTGLKIFPLDYDYFPPELIHLQYAPLRSFHLNSIHITQESLEAIVSILRNCHTLDTVFLGSLSVAATVVDKLTIFDAVASNPSIRDFKSDFNCEKNMFSRILSLIRDSKTLRHLSVSCETDGSLEQFKELLDALTTNLSLVSFKFGFMRISMDDPEERSVVTNSVCQFLAQNRTMKSLQIGMQGLYIREEINRAFEENPIAQHLRIGLIRELSKPVSKKNIAYHSINYEALNILKAGRRLAFSKKIHGQQVPAEIIDLILQQMTADSAWPDEMWKPIRRAVMNHATIGLLCSDTRKFDAHELLNICHNVDQ